jgi:hypothetical protein
LKLTRPKIFLIFFLFLQLLHAKDIDYSFKLSNSTPYLREAVLLEVNLSQVNHDIVLLVNFTLKTSEDYEFHQISLDEEHEYHALKHHYIYLIYPKKSGEISLGFTLIKSLTDDEKVSYAMSGDRDNVKGLEKTEVAVPIKPLTLKVKPLPQPADLVGDFTLTHKLDKKRTKAFEPIYLNVKLKGTGLLNPFELYKKSSSFKRFSQAPKFSPFYTKTGEVSSLEWNYAFSLNKNFLLPKRTLKVFNPKTETFYELVVPEYNISVQAVNSEELLDKVDTPTSSKGIDWELWRWIGSYLLVFLAGVLMPRNLFKRRTLKTKSSQEILKERIREAKSHKELLKLLVVENSSSFSEAIKSLELVVYNGEKISLSKIKELL